MGERFATTGPGPGGPVPSRCWRCWPPWSRRPGPSRPRRRGGRVSVVVAGGFVVALAGSSWLFHQTFVAMLAGGRQPAWSVLVQVALVFVGFVALSYDPRLGTALLAGLFGAMFAVNLWAMRKARGNRAAVDAQEAAAEQVRVEERQQAVAERPPHDSRPAVDVGAVLDTARRAVWQRWLAWLVAGGAVAGAAALLTDSGPAVFMVLFLTGAILLWVGRAAWSVGLARRDFRAARTPPERAWVVLLHDPTPRMIRPLLGVWTEEPVVRASVFPRPDVVFRCDDDLDDLLSHQGEVAVHEAWVDTSRPRHPWCPVGGRRRGRRAPAPAGVPRSLVLLLAHPRRASWPAEPAPLGAARSGRPARRLGVPGVPGPRAGEPAAVAGRRPRGARGAGAAPRVRLRRSCGGRWPSRGRRRRRGCRRTRRGRPRCRCRPAAAANRSRIVLTIEVTGWFSANAAHRAGHGSVGTKAELMNGRKISG